MKAQTRSGAVKLLLASGAAVMTTVLFAGPAAASVSDNFRATTSDGCGAVNFIDYGPGAPGGGDNDDYAVIHDYCTDGHGVRANGVLTDKFGNHFNLGSKYNGNGSGSAVVWDPFKQWGNVREGDVVSLEVCLVDGPDDPSPSRCGHASHESADG